MRRCLDGQQLSTSRVSLTRAALTHCLHLNFNLDINFNFNTPSTPTPPQPACATITVRHTFTGQLSVHLFSSHTVWKLQPRTSYALTTAHAPPPPQSTSNVRRCALWTVHIVRCAHNACTLCVMHTMRALGGIRFVQLVASQPSESTSAIHCDGPHHPHHPPLFIRAIIGPTHGPHTHHL